MNLYGILSLIAFIVNPALGVYVIAYNPKENVSKIFALLTENGTSAYCFSYGMNCANRFLVSFAIQNKWSDSRISLKSHQPKE